MTDGGPDWAYLLFPGNPMELPSEEERDNADLLIAECSVRWGENPITVDRVHPDVSPEGLANYVAGTPTNRAYLRASLRRWWKRP